MKTACLWSLKMNQILSSFSVSSLNVGSDVAEYFTVINPMPYNSTRILHIQIRKWYWLVLITLLCVGSISSKYLEYVHFSLSVIIPRTGALWSGLKLPICPACKFYLAQINIFKVFKSVLKLNITAPGLSATSFYDFLGESCPVSLIK